MPVTRGVDFVLNVKGDADRKIAGLATASTAYAVAGKRAETTTAGFAKQLGGLKEATEKLQLGTLSRGIGMVLGSMTALASPTNVAAVAIGGVAIASVAAVAGLAKLVLGAKAWHDELRLAGAAEDLISDEQVRDLERMNASLGGLGVELKRVAIIIATDFAPMIERAATKLLYLLQQSEKIIQATDWLKVFLTVAGGPAMGIAINAWELFAKVLEKVGIKAGQATDQIREATQEFGRFKTDNPVSFGEKAGGLKGAMDAAMAYAPKGATKPRDRSGDVSIDFTEEIEEQTRLLRDAQEKARETLRLAEAAAAMRTKTLEQGAELIAEITQMQEGLKMAIVNQSLGAVASVKDAGDLAVMVGNAIVPGMGSAVAAGVEIAMNANSVLKEIRQGLIRGPEQIIEGLTKALTNGIPRFIRALPRILESINLARFSTAFLKALLEAIPRLVAAMAVAFFKAIKSAFEAVVDFFRGGEDRNVLTGRREKFLGTSFKRGQFSVFGIGNADDDPDAGETGHGKRGHGSGSRMGRNSRMTGGYIDRTGSYRLHAGERVVPPTGASTSAAMSAMRGGSKGGGTVNIGTVIGMDVRELVRMIRRELGDYGTGATLTPRGA